MAVKSIKVLVKLDFPNGATFRLWDGSGPYLDANGELWQGVRLNDGLDQIESAMNGEAVTLLLSVSGVNEEGAGLAFEDLEAGNVIGGTVQLSIQPLDEWDQPEGDVEVRFTGSIDNMPMDDAAMEEGIVSTITLEVTNRFDLRTLTSGGVLSDVDQKARSAILNPGAPNDRFAERIAGLADKTIVWPRFS
ncbi:hypothetical protein ASD04_14975 [Devosia sp. Root436]|uniref:hypothetical protein n=1 Tax=Devosia sp. Root436 TaxID=1736537 RepID=UPI0006F4AC12|nr:hypothetical protein [Devosia sp. Root436]KQX35340.1 hypothetical protein ASD04_14975 [Devosia sp. Root436]